MLKQIKILRITAVLLLIVFIFTSYKSYDNYGLEKFISQHPSSILIEKKYETLFIGEENTLTIKFENIPNYNLDKDHLVKLIKSFKNEIQLKELEIVHKSNKKYNGNNFISFNLVANFMTDKSNYEFLIMNKYIVNNDGEKFYIKGYFPEIKEFGTYSYSSSSYEIKDGDDFEVMLKLENVDEIKNLPKISIYSTKGNKPPLSIGSSIIERTKGQKGKVNYIIKQKFRAISSGVFQTLSTKIPQINNEINLKTFAIEINEIFTRYQVESTEPQFINDRFFIKVYIANAPIKNRSPIFPSIEFCPKADQKINEEKINSKYSNITFIQYYKADYDGIFNVDDIVIFIGDKKERYKIQPFEIKYDCSSIHNVRLNNGTEPLKLKSRNFSSSHYITIKNNNTKDVFVKVVNKSNDKAVRAIYVRNNMSSTVRGLSWGTYYLVVAYGSHWDKKRNIFRCNTSYAVFNKSDHLMPLTSDYDGWEMTLYRVSGYSYNEPRSISETTFLNY